VLVILMPPLLLDLLRNQRHNVQDWQQTNNANTGASWQDRATPTSLSYDGVLIKMPKIKHVTALTSNQPAFFRGQPVAVATTLTAHGFASGQSVSVTGTSGSYRLLGSTTSLAFDTAYPRMVLVINATSFAYSLADWSWNERDPGVDPAAISPGGQAGWAVVRINTGVPFESAAELSARLTQDVWVCVPHAATDDYIQQMAAWWAGSLPRGQRLYVELSNEVSSADFCIMSRAEYQ
jgi:hypothetical protein